MKKCMQCGNYYVTEEVELAGYCEPCEVFAQEASTFYETADDVDAWVAYQNRMEEDES